ncbi:UDP-N-acetylmuramoyl-L-alanine--D-glutamate ligase, partial [bacterium]|nr:UDP-N-acetylmuramoyl-L-alanine--D-glutamate ligase [bacterium]
MDARPAPSDSAIFQAQFPNVKILYGPWTDASFAEATILVVSPGIPGTDPALQAAKARGVLMLGDIGLFMRVAPAPVVAITGSNGKTTVTTWVGDIVRGAGWSVQVGGNIGVPALELLASPKPD